MRERELYSGGRVAFHPAEHVGVVLCIGVEPRDRDADVAVEQISSLNDRIVAELLGGRSLPLDVDARAGTTFRARDR